MGDAKRRREQSAAVAATLTPEQRLLRKAARHLLDDFLRPSGLGGACHYTAFALHHHLAVSHGLLVPVQAGWVRSEGIAWAMHSWLDVDGRKTDLAIHFPNPPVAPGDLLIDGELVARGQTAALYTLDPDDGVPTVIEASADAASQRRRIGERDLFKGLADSGDLSAIEAYLAGDRQLHAKLQGTWSRFAA